LELTGTLGSEVEHEIGMHFAHFFGHGFRHDADQAWRDLGRIA
jgi:hypothetical protein